MRPDPQTWAPESDGTQIVVLLGGSVTNAREIADVFGRDALAQVTTVVAERLLAHADLPARLLDCTPDGGFVVTVVVERDLHRTQIAALVGQACRLVSIDGDQVWPVIGVSACAVSPEAQPPTWSDLGATALTVAHRAPGQVLWHGDEPRSWPREELALARDLARALDEADALQTRDPLDAGAAASPAGPDGPQGPEPGGLHLVYQPIVDLRTGEILGAEALLRWDHPVLGAVSPLVAVGTAERTGQIARLGRRVLTMALTQAAAWARMTPPGFRVHVNASSLELRDHGYVDQVGEELARAGLLPQRLLVEVTESSALVDDPAVLATLHALSDLKVAVGIDDFGTGYSSIALLRRAPVDVVKVDRSLVAGIANGPAEFALARSTFAMIAALGRSVVAEGIEHAMEVSHLRAMGCHVGQGFHLARPMPAAALTRRLGGHLEPHPLALTS